MMDFLIKEFVDAIKKFSEPERIILFGSRAQGFEREHSDIDIAIEDHEVTDRQMRLIREAIEDIRTLHKIDIVWLDKISEGFRNEILRIGQNTIRRTEKGCSVLLADILLA